jgi:hypothetical protein
VIRSCALGVASDYGLDNRVVAVRVPQVEDFFSSPSCPDKLRSPPSLLSSGSGPEADHSLPDNSDVMNT